MFVFGGIDALRRPETKTDKADVVADALGQPLGTTSRLVQANGAAMVIAGLCLATGKAPRTSAAVLAASLAPTTYAGHRFWEIDDPADRRGQQIHFMKNLSLMGGLVLAASDAGGQRSKRVRPQRARRVDRRVSRRTARRLDRARIAMSAAPAGALATAAAAGQWARQRAHDAADSTGPARHAADRALREVAGRTRDLVNEDTLSRTLDQAAQLAHHLREAV